MRCNAITNCIIEYNYCVKHPQVPFYKWSMKKSLTSNQVWKCHYLCTIFIPHLHVEMMSTSKLMIVDYYHIWIIFTRKLVKVTGQCHPISNAQPSISGWKSCSLTPSLPSLSLSLFALSLSKEALRGQIKLDR